MLTEAIEISNEHNNKIYTWYDTDFQILEKILKSSSDVSGIISMMMKGLLYGCFGIYKTKNTSKLNELSKVSVRRRIEKEINDLFKREGILFISDFTTDEQRSIKGIKGIYYDKEKCELKIVDRANKKRIEYLANNHT